jgi:bifunctional N-acetylglucosamine-1-phosphate-uridyltransferase/glucosamine-1-phosphate-acetyltransferase GlmU-like protein
VSAQAARDLPPWRAVVAALDENGAFRSRVTAYLHPLAGRPTLWHVVRALLEAPVPPREVVVLHRLDAPTNVDVPDGAPVHHVPVLPGDEARALRAAVTPPGMTVLVDGGAALLTPSTIVRLLRAAEHGVAAVHGPDEVATRVAVAGEGPALASAEDPRMPAGAQRVTPSTPAELLQVTDRHSLSDAAVALRDRLVRHHERHGVSFLLPATSWLDVDVRIGADTLVYPGVVLEGSTDVGGECVIGPYSRIVDSVIGRGAELKGWNYLCRSHLRSRAVLEAYARRGDD